MANSLTSPEQIEQDIVTYFASKLAPEGVGADTDADPSTMDSAVQVDRLKQLFAQALREDQISAAEEAAFLLTIPATFTIYSAQQVFDSLIVDARQKQILAVVTGFNAANWQDVTVADVAKFVRAPRRKQPDYRTPVGFADLRRRFLTEIKQRSDVNQLDLYIKAMNLFEQKLYGQRFEYYRQFELMRKNAQAMNQDIDKAHSEDLGTATDELSVEADHAHYNAQSPSKTQFSHITTISDEHRDQLLGHAIIEGDAWRQGHQDYHLNIASLVSAGLVPKHEIVIDKQTIYLTSLFELTNGQKAALAYIPVSGNAKVRAYYRDKSQALWRYLPDYIRDLSGEGIDAYGVGFDARSTILPAELQAALNQIEVSHGTLDLSATNPDFLFAGTAPAYNTRQEFRDAFMKGQLRGDFYHEVSSYAANSDADNLITSGRRKNVPQLISINSDFAPNFQQPLANYVVDSDFAGEVHGEAFYSEDRQTIWLFYNDYRNRVWIANCETTSPVTTTGCRRDWNLLTDLTTPLYELTSLADGYGEPDDVRPGNHIAMWNNYLSKIPLMQTYGEILGKGE